MFDDPAAVARYADGPPRQVPGFHDLHTMALVLLSGHVPARGRVLVLGAGGGLELKAFAAARPGWRFDGVDPSAEMLGLAAANTAPFAARIALIEGTIDAAPAGPFDGAVCLLTLHFIAPDERRRTLEALRARMAPGAPLVVAHHSVSREPAERAFWLAQYAGFAAEKGVDPERAAKAGASIAQHLPLLAPEEDEAILAAAGFTDIRLFYAAFSFRGWVAVA
ncbi:class I SAM-dependent methyltransferase [Acuticoccus sp. I52.16.1]|uniref:class I SAM-dependent methyltransferase n=1 Tax=Acuticoccus sp. I52.16.1 TaxID=2928472 RepID=UPI001FD5D842|nr:class I SAM-dependent methyltransferase [Acuticoccus sp. I52.16.1]UOM35139.1 methyltransferase domain-containing protein [Acuticoccus sp. I52.16.1]